MSADWIPHHEVADLIIVIHNRVFEHEREFHRVNCEVAGKRPFMNRGIPSPAGNLIFLGELAWRSGNKDGTSVATGECSANSAMTP